MPRVPKIGELESWIQEVPSLHTMQPGGFTDVIYTEGLKIIMTEENWRDGRSTFIPTGVPVKPVHWFGYVSDVSRLWFRSPSRKPGSWHLPPPFSFLSMGRSRLLSRTERKYWSLCNV
jgi:hypothetical protein